jgi:hypothetical protein
MNIIRKCPPNKKSILSLLYNLKATNRTALKNTSAFFGNTNGNVQTSSRFSFHWNYYHRPCSMGKNGHATCLWWSFNKLHVLFGHDMTLPNNLLLKSVFFILLKHLFRLVSTLAIEKLYMHCFFWQNFVLLLLEEKINVLAVRPFQIQILLFSPCTIVEGNAKLKIMHHAVTFSKQFLLSFLLFPFLPLGVIRVLTCAQNLCRE